MKLFTMPDSNQQPRYGLVVDADKCQGHNRCHALLPELIRVDDLGFAHALGEGLVPASLLEKARLAVGNCPEYAVRLKRLENEGDSQ